MSVVTALFALWRERKPFRAELMIRGGEKEKKENS
jgi:hypothetical protein